MLHLLRRPFFRWRNALVLAALLGGAGAVQAGQPVRLESHRAVDDTTAVQVLLEVGGELKLVEEEKVVPLKMSVVGKMAYSERLLELSSRAETGRSIRHYETAEATIKIDQGGIAPKLRDDRRLVTVAATADEATLFGSAGPLTREEVDLIDVPGNSLLVDRLLPPQAVEIGDTWSHDKPLLAALLRLDAVSSAEVKSKLTELDETTARMELEGIVEGAFGGVPCEMQLKGRYKFDRSSGRVTWFALLIQEKRSIGLIGPGTDLVARLQMTITPRAADPELSDRAISQLELKPRDENALLEYAAADGAYSFVHDRRWHVTAEKKDTLALRMVDRGQLIAQCNVTEFPTAEPGKYPSLQRFQDDIQQSLGKSFGQFIEASEGEHPRGYVVYRVACQGEVSELPVQWIYYLIAHPQGPRIVLTFTVENELLDKLEAADEAIVSTVDLQGPKPATAAKALPRR